MKGRDTSIHHTPPLIGRTRRPMRLGSASAEALRAPPRPPRPSPTPTAARRRAVAVARAARRRIWRGVGRRRGHARGARRVALRHRRERPAQHSTIMGARTCVKRHVRALRAAYGREAPVRRAVRGAKRPYWTGLGAKVTHPILVEDPTRRTKKLLTFRLVRRAAAGPRQRRRSIVAATWQLHRDECHCHITGSAQAVWSLALTAWLQVEGRLPARQCGGLLIFA